MISVCRTRVASQTNVGYIEAHRYSPKEFSRESVTIGIFQPRHKTCLCIPSGHARKPGLESVDPSQHKDYLLLVGHGWFVSRTQFDSKSKGVGIIIVSTSMDSFSFSPIFLFISLKSKKKSTTAMLIAMAMPFAVLKNSVSGIIVNLLRI
jgi:hypothetical protein